MVRDRAGLAARPARFGKADVRQLLGFSGDGAGHGRPSRKGSFTRRSWHALAEADPALGEAVKVRRLHRAVGVSDRVPALLVRLKEQDIQPVSHGRQGSTESRARQARSTEDRQFVIDMQDGPHCGRRDGDGSCGGAATGYYGLRRTGMVPVETLFGKSYSERTCRCYESDGLRWR